MRRPPALLLLLAAIATLSAGVPVELPEGPEERKDDPEARAAWWHRQRAFPAADIPKDAWARARAPFRAARKKARDAAPIVWKAIGPAPLDTSKGLYETPNMSPSAGRASAIAVDPTDPKTIYAGYALGGVWKTTDGGTTWAPLMDYEPTLAVGALAIDPATPGTLYVGTGEPAPYIGYAGLGILRSGDGGKTFDKVGGTVFDGLVISRIIIDSAAGALYASATFGSHGRGQNCNNDYDAPGQGLYRSTDGGQTWSPLKDGKIIDVEIDTSVTPRRILISDFAAGAFLSEDGGKTWSAPAGLPTAQDKARRIEIAFSKADPSVVYAGMGLGSVAALFISKDSGKSFTKIDNAPDYCGAQCYYDNSIAVDPTNPYVVYLGGGLCGAWKATNAGDTNPTWANITLPGQNCKGGAAWPMAYIHPDIHDIVFDPESPSTVYFATDGGLARTTDAGGTFAQLNDGVGTLQVYALCGDPAGTGAIYGGAQDNGVFARTTTGWRGIVAADGGPCAVDSGDPNIVLATTEYASVLRTKNAFSTTPTFVFGTEQCTAGAPGCGDRVTFIAPLVSDPSTPSTFYVGTYRVWKTTSAGVSSSWKAVSDDLTAGPASVGCADAKGFGKLDDGLTVLAVAPSKPEVLYTGAQSGRMFTTKDGGANWTRIDKAPLPGRWVSAIAVDPHNPDVVFASFSGFSDGTPGAPGHVFRSADGGKTWELRDIPADTPVNTILAHGTASDLLYAGTDGGVLFTSDGGKTWSPLGDGLPSVPVFSLVYQRAAGTLVAGTFGRSVWSAALPSGAVTVAPDKLTFSAESGKIPVGQSIKVSAADPSGGVTRFSVAASETWLSETPTTGEVAGAIPQVVHVVASPGKLAVGDHDASITITPEGGGAAITVPVRLTITAPTKPTEEDGGCSCRVGADGSASAWKAIAAMAAIGMLRRRRRG